MNATGMNNSSKTNWERVDSLTDKKIATTDIPPVTETRFGRAKAR